MIASHKVTKHACTSSWLPLAHSIHHTYHQVTVMNKQQKKQGLLTTHIYIYISHVNVTQTVPDISPLMPMHQDPLLVSFFSCALERWAWWRHQMETFSSLLALCAGNSPVTGEFPAQKPVTRNCDVFFDLRLNKRLSKQSWCWWFETPSR